MYLLIQEFFLDLKLFSDSGDAAQCNWLIITTQQCSYTNQIASQIIYTNQSNTPIKQVSNHTNQREF